MAHPSFHEDLCRGRHAQAPGSDRAFGFVFAVCFGAIGLWPLRDHRPVRAWAVALALALLAIALTAPGLLRPLNRLWFRLGQALERLTTPALMAAIFFGAVTPTAWFLRMLGQVPLRLSMDPSAETYWIPRRPPGTAPDSMRRQF